MKNGNFKVTNVTFIELKSLIFDIQVPEVNNVSFVSKTIFFSIMAWLCYYKYGKYLSIKRNIVNVTCLCFDNI